MKMKSVLSSVLIATGLVLAGCANQGQPKGVTVNQTSRGVEITSMDSILFDTGKFEINSGGTDFLDRVANVLKTRTKKDVMIEGHTDNVGGADYNKELSDLRALSVVKALIDRGVPKSRLKAMGYGATKPIADNATENGRRLNRRTNIIILDEKKENLGNDPFSDLLGKIKGAFQ
ncbi:OmpA family protein [Leeia sp. TBRC 13508]|uniref:OmpA family protein n=1 Tax=Leeia speluncae TaxID=2884804 RepID=A0ABS8D4D9_9NEIS|nr:OmpA family protein [Leeia speluncae]MCB6183060.1 OmpA family protein [Leeia speluncae]